MVASRSKETEAASHARRLHRPYGSSSVHNADRCRDLRNTIRLPIGKVAEGNYSNALERSSKPTQRTLQRKCPSRPLLHVHSDLRVQCRAEAPRGAVFPILSHSQSKISPHGVLNIQPGELVRIKSKSEIEQTLNMNFKNRGLWFDKEMTRFCGGKYRVLARVDHQIDERTGKMVTFKTPCITLEGVTATGEYFEFAPLDERIYWREIWVERAEAGSLPAVQPGVGVAPSGEKNPNRTPWSFPYSLLSWGEQTKCTGAFAAI